MELPVGRAIWEGVICLNQTPVATRKWRISFIKLSHPGPSHIRQLKLCPSFLPKLKTALKGTDT
jgi:hypothetical protein